MHKSNVIISGLLLLQTAQGSPITESNLDKQHFSSIQVVADITLRICKGFLNSTRASLPKICPFLIPSLYRSAIIYLADYQNTRDEEAWLSIRALKDVLEILDGRWKASGT